MFSDTIAREIYINDGQIRLKPAVDLENLLLEDFSSFLKHEGSIDFKNQKNIENLMNFKTENFKTENFKTENLKNENFKNENFKNPSFQNHQQDEIPSYTQEILFTSDMDATQTKSTNSEPNVKKEDSSFDSWSIVWYIASFGGLIVFFLIVSCSEWCCRKQVRQQQAQEVPRTTTRPNSPVSDVPPPAYELFAPPPYDSCLFSKDGEKHKFDVYVVPVHAIRPISNDPQEEGRREAPPSYAAINIRTIAAQTQNTPT